MTMTTTGTPAAAEAQDTVYALAAAGRWIYAGRLTGVYRSGSGTAGWQAVPPPQHEQIAVTALAAQGDVVFAGVKGAVLRSEDAGEHWETIGLALPPPQVVALAISPNFQQDGIVAAGTAEDGIFVSADRGTTWVPWNFGLFDPQVYALAFSPAFQHDRTIYAGTASGVFMSTNAGRSWQDLPFPRESAPVLSLALAPEGRLLAGTEAGGLLLTDAAGAAWRQVSEAGTVNALHAGSGRMLALLDDTLIVSTDAETWTALQALPAGKLALTILTHPTAPDQALVGFADGEIRLLEW